MTSKNFYSKLIKESVKRRLSIFILVSLVWFFKFVVPAMFQLGKRNTYGYPLTWLNNTFINMVSFKNGFICFWIIIMSVVCGLSSFYYLNSKSKVDFYHSLPIKREQYFAANFVAGVLLTMIPYLISLIMCVLIGAMSGVNDVGLLITQAGIGFLYHIIFYLLCYSTTVLAAMLTGNLVIGFMGTITFFGYFPVLLWVFYDLFSNNFNTYHHSFGNWFEFLISKCSPFTAYIFAISEFENGTNNIWKIVLGAAVMSIVLAIVSLLLYRKRPSEGAGKALVFHISKPIVRIFIVVVASLIMGSAFEAIQDSFLWILFGLLCGAVISHCLLEAIYHFDVRKIFTHWKQLILCIICSIFILLSFKIDIFGYDRYLPNRQQVQSAAINIHEIDNWLDYGNVTENSDGSYEWNYINGDDYIFRHMKVTDIDPILEIAQAGSGSSNVWRDEENFEENYHDRYTNVAIQYTLTNGRKVTRAYYLPLHTIKASIEKIVVDPAYQIGKFPLLTQTASEFTALKYSEGSEIYSVDELKEEQLEQLLNAYQNEFMDITVDDRKKELPIGMIRFLSEEEKEAISVNASREYAWRNLTNVGFYPIYPSQVQTIRLLEELKVPVGRLWTQSSIDQIRLTGESISFPGNSYVSSSVDWEWNSIITKEEDIHTMLQHSVPYDSLYQNIFYEEADLISFAVDYHQTRGDMGKGDRLVPLEYLPIDVQNKGKVKTDK